MISLLLIDDDTELTAILSQYLSLEGFDAHVVHDGDSGVREALKGTYDIVVLDVMMPRLSGMEVLRRIRATSMVPVIMLTARGDNIDRIVGLEMGADDYVPKPCTPGELVARLRAILRRTKPIVVESLTSLNCLKSGELELWPGRRQAIWQGASLELTGTEFSLMEVLARQVGHLVSKQELSKHVFGRPLAPFERRIDVHISSIRQKMGPRPDGQPWILGVRGMGYQLLTD
jgi:two-component system OmpR family response regulator